MARTSWLTTVGVAALLLSGCAATAAPGVAPPPAPSHTMPDGTVMSGAQHDHHGDHGPSGAAPAPSETADAAAVAQPSHAAEMVCGGQVLAAVNSMFGLSGKAGATWSWNAPDFTCTYDIDGAPLVLGVHDVDDEAVGEAHFTALQSELGAADIEGMLGLGLPSFSTGEGVVGFLRDAKTLTVDATALPEGFAGGMMTHDEAAYAIASAVLVCWVEHD